MTSKWNAIVARGVQIGSFDSAEEATTHLDKLGYVGYELVHVIEPLPMSGVLTLAHTFVRQTPSDTFENFLQALTTIGGIRATQEEAQKAFEQARILLGVVDLNERNRLSAAKLAEKIFMEHEPAPTKLQLVQLLRTERPQLTPQAATTAVNDAQLFM